MCVVRFVIFRVCVQSTAQHQYLSFKLVYKMFTIARHILLCSVCVQMLDFILCAKSLPYYFMQIRCLSNCDGELLLKWLKS